jgi:signal transduction histidine kinase
VPTGETRTPLTLAVLGLLLLLAITLTLRRARALVSQRSEFAAAVTHELRTPLTQILLNAETLQYRRVRSEQERETVLAAIVREARRLVYLLENVLHFSRAERQRLRLRTTPIRLDLLLADQLDELRTLVAESRTAVEVEAAEPVIAAVDSAALALVLTNLIVNVAHHAPGSPVRIAVRGNSAAAEILVDDQGPGIPVADRERMLLPFERLARSAAGHPGGSGIGLAVVRELMEAMGGQVWLEDAPGGGLRVRLVIPGTGEPVPELSSVG